MTVTFGSGERTQAEFVELAARAGLSVRSTEPVDENLRLIELERGDM